MQKNDKYFGFLKGQVCCSAQRLLCLSYHRPPKPREGGDRRDRGVADVAVSAPVVAAEMEPPFRALLRYLRLEDVMYPDQAVAYPVLLI
jgi:hypothetical protein